MRFFTLVVLALLAVRQNASARLNATQAAQMVSVHTLSFGLTSMLGPWLGRSPDDGNEPVELCPTSLDDSPYPVSWRKIVVVGRTVDEYIENFNKELDSYLLQQDWNFTDGAYFDDSELVEALNLDLPEWQNNTESTILLEVGSVSGAWKETSKTKFVPVKWQAMVADIGHFVGSGTFGNVYVIDTTMGMKKDRDSTVAMKVEKKPGNIEQSEVELGKTFNHPNLVKVWDSDHFKKRLVMLMESLHGGDLEEGYKLIGSRKGRKAIVRAMLEMFVALRYLHNSAGYVHSDFKPAQVILSKKANGIAKLGDFGLACEDGSDDVAGSPIFMSPELLNTKKRTYSVDMWAMGISLYTIFFDDEVPPSLRGAGDVHGLLQRIKNLGSHCVLHPSGSPLDDLIKGLLTVDVSKRFNAEKALRYAVQWAKSEDIDVSDIKTIVEADLTGKRDALPAAWDPCVDLSCQGEPCKEIRVSPIEVQCGVPRVAQQNEVQYSMVNFNDQQKPLKYQPGKEKKHKVKDDVIGDYQAKQAKKIQQLLNQKEGRNKVNAPRIAEPKRVDNPMQEKMQNQVLEKNVNKPQTAEPKAWDNPMRHILQRHRAEREELIQKLKLPVSPEERLKRKSCSAVEGAIPRESAYRRAGVSCKCPEDHKVWCGKVEIARQKFKLSHVANCGFGLSCSKDAPY